jgi:hypothetical protein
LGSSIRKNLALEGSQRWFRGYRIARSELMGLLHLRTQSGSGRISRKSEAQSTPFASLRPSAKPILTWLGAGLASGAPVRVRPGLFADFLRKLERLDEAGRCAFCWIWWGRRYL